jgi:hypothetical protein
MYLGDSAADRRAARQAAREARQGARDQARAERQAAAFVRRLREPVSPTEELEIPSAQLPPALVQQPTPAMPQTPYGMPVETEAETVSPAAPAPASGGNILPLLIGGAALLLLG